MQKIFGVVVIYFPDESVIGNMLSYLDYVEKLIIIDNSSPASSIHSNISDKVVIIQNHKNLGISIPLNQAVEYCKNEGADWLLTMDQDSKFLKEEIGKYLTCASNFEGLENVGMFGLNYEEKSADGHCGFEETDNLITSGSLVNIKVALQIGGFDENLFIDEVDSEYCLCLNRNGFKTIKYNHIHLLHNLGTANLCRSFKTGKLTKRALHSNIRIYYMVRNYLYLRKLYKIDFPKSFPHRRKAILNRIKNKLLYGENKLQLIKYIIRAIRDYRNGKMGFCQDVKQQQC